MENSFVSSFKTCSFENFWFKNFILNILNVPMLKLLVAYVPKYHLRIQTACNILLQLRKGKQGRVIGGVVEGEGI